MDNTMKHCLLNSGRKMPMIGLGTWQIKVPVCSIETGDIVDQAVNNALNVGYRMIDTAAVYKNESDIGKSLKKSLPLYNLKRSDLFITSKLAPGDQGFDSAYNACIQSIKDLGCDYLDLYLIHWPGKSGLKQDDPKNKVYRTQSWKALEKLQAEGYVKDIGVSNYLLRHLEEMSSYTTVIPAVNQVEFHPYLYQKDLLDYCRSKNIVFQAYSSLGIGKFTGDHYFVELAAKYQKTTAQILYRWAIEHDVAILPKSTNVEHMKENLDVLNFTLSKEDTSAMGNLNKNAHVCWNPEEVA